MPFTGILGQDNSIAVLSRSLAADKIAHAYLFDGIEGCGKRKTALAFIEAVFCGQREGCGHCPSCRKLAAGADFILTQPVYDACLVERFLESYQKEHARLETPLLVGVLLYVALSPITRAALTDMGAPMHNPTWRFWTVEHPALMIVAVVFGHVGRIVARRAGKGTSPSLRAPAVWYALAVVAILAAVPWPFLSHGRPLFRF